MAGKNLATNVRHKGLASIGLLLLVAAAPGATQKADPWILRVAPQSSPASAGSAQPQLTVSSRGVLLSWVERQGPTATLKFSEFVSTGWTTARTVASGDNWFVNWADVPSVFRMPTGTLVGHWLQKEWAGDVCVRRQARLFDRRRPNLFAVVSSTH